MKWHYFMWLKTHKRQSKFWPKNPTHDNTVLLTPLLGGQTYKYSRQEMSIIHFLFLLAKEGRGETGWPHCTTVPSLYFNKVTPSTFLFCLVYFHLKLPCNKFKYVSCWFSFKLFNDHECKRVCWSVCGSQVIKRPAPIHCMLGQTPASLWLWIGLHGYGRVGCL